MAKYFSLVFLVFSLTLSASDEAEIKELKAQVIKILSRLEYLENKALTKKQKNKKVVKVEQTKLLPKPNLELKTKDTVLSVGGKIELDFNYASPDTTLSARSIPIDATDNSLHQSFNATNSRIWIKTRTPSKYGMIRTLVESDFFGVKGTENNTNSSGLRLRHAYINIGNWTVGQTNSVFNIFTPLELLYLPINDVFARQPLIKYSSEGKLLSYDISLEQAETTLLDSSSSIITPKDDLFPDVVARVRYYPSWGEAGFAVIGRYINQNRYGSFENKDSAFGWGANLSAKIKVGKYDDIRFHTIYGMGLGRYISYSAYPAGYINDAGEITLQPSYSSSLGYRHWWNKELRSTISLALSGTKNEADFLDTINKKAYSSQINLLWTPFTNYLIGVEYVKAKRVLESGEDGELDTALLRIRYDY